MSFTYSVTAWGFEASRASTSSALRSDLSGFLPASAATESPALVMSPKTARLVRVAMGVCFSRRWARPCASAVREKGRRKGGVGGLRGRLRSAVRRPGGFGVQSGPTALFAVAASLWRGLGAPRRRAGPRSATRWLLLLTAETLAARPFRSRSPVLCCAWVRRAPAKRFFARAGSYSGGAAANCEAVCGATGPGRPVWGIRQPSAARLPGPVSIPRAPKPPPPEVSTAGHKTKQYGFHRAQKSA